MPLKKGQRILSNYCKELLVLQDIGHIEYKDRHQRSITGQSFHEQIDDRLHFLTCSQKISRVSLVGTCGNSKRTGFDFNDGSNCAENPEQDEQFSVFLIPLRSKIRIPLHKMDLH